MAKIITVPNNPLPKIKTLNVTMTVSPPTGVEDPRIEWFDLTLKGSDYTVWKTNTYAEELNIKNAKYAEGDAIHVVGQVTSEQLAPTINYSYSSLEDQDEKKILQLRPTALTKSYGIYVDTVKEVFDIGENEELPALLPIQFTKDYEPIENDYYAYLTADKLYYLIPIAIFLGEELWNQSFSATGDTERQYTYYTLNSGTDGVALGEYVGYSSRSYEVSAPLYESTYSVSVTYNNQTSYLEGVVPFTEVDSSSDGVFILTGLSSPVV